MSKDDIDEIVGLDADCVLYMPPACDFDEGRVAHGRVSFLTAHRAVNVVPVACEAASGIRTTADLPQVIATLG